MKLLAIIMLSIFALPLTARSDDISAIIGSPKEKSIEPQVQIEKTEANGYVIYESKEEMFSDLDVLITEINNMSGGKYYAIPKSIINILQTQYGLAEINIDENSIEKEVECSYSNFQADTIGILKPIIDLSLVDDELQKIKFRNQIRDGITKLNSDCKNDSVFIKKLPEFLTDFSSAMNIYASAEKKKAMQPEIDKEVLNRVTKADTAAEKHQKNIVTASLFAKCAAVYSATAEFSAIQKTENNQKQVDLLSNMFGVYAAMSRIYSKYGYTIPVIQKERNVIKDKIMLMMRSDMSAYAVRDFSSYIKARVDSCETSSNKLANEVDVKLAVAFLSSEEGKDFSDKLKAILRQGMVSSALISVLSQ